MDLILGGFRLPVSVVQDLGPDGEWSAEGISLDSKLRGSHLAMVLAHESLHQLFHLAGIDLETELDEEIATKLAPWIVSWVVQNPTMWGEIIRLSQGVGEPQLQT